MAIKYIAFRFDVQHIDDVLSFYQDHDVIICEEVGSKAEKVHIHGIAPYIGEFKNYQKMLYRCCKDVCNTRGGDGSKSSKEVDDIDAAIRYICKGESTRKLPDILRNTLKNPTYNLEPVDVKKYHTWYWEINSQLHEQVKEEKKSVSAGYIKPVIKYIKKTYPSVDLLQIKPDEMEQYILEWYVVQGKTYMDFYRKLQTQAVTILDHLKYTLGTRSVREIAKRRHLIMWSSTQHKSYEE